LLERASDGAAQGQSYVPKRARRLAKKVSRLARRMHGDLARRMHGDIRPVGITGARQASAPALGSRLELGPLGRCPRPFPRAPTLDQDIVVLMMAFWGPRPCRHGGSCVGSERIRYRSVCGWKGGKALSAVKDMVRLRFGRLTVVRRAGSDAAAQATWLCRCDCGDKIVARGSDLRRGNTTSCGCRGSRTGAMNVKHGHAKGYKKSPEYCAWASLLARCYRPTSDAFPWYGGAGIEVCKRWRYSFSAFLADMGSKPAPDFILARKHKDRGYTPSNCEWSVTRKGLRRWVPPLSKSFHREGPGR
jgi:hypothetical protein